MKILKISFFLFLVLCSVTVHAQREGDKWVIGYSDDSTNHQQSIMHLDFSGAKLNIEWHFNETMEIDKTAANICDASGEAILWTNGMQVFGKHGTIVAEAIAYDSDPLSYWNYFSLNGIAPLGFPKHDGALILPVPGGINEYEIIYHSAEVHPDGYFQITKYLSARIRLNEDASYDVLYQDSLIGPYHKWYTGTISATRHANGRDWWITSFEADSPGYYSYLLDPQGIRLDHQGNVDRIVKEGLGQAAFSSQGNYLARLDAITTNEGQYITLYSFDRCAGDFQILETFHNPVAGIFTGVAFSPSERYLYGDDNDHLWQWDLWAEDIAASQTLVDTFDGFIQPGWFGTYFGPIIAAPDGRIYIVPPSGSSEFMHVIDRPDLPAAECRLKQHYINLRRPQACSAPNLPNFRCGPLDGSPCDTLGLDNHPVARWRFEEDQPGWWYDIRFTDLSFFDPETWHWDFDDGLTSDERSPVHTFEPGLYQVCLTVSNAYDTDSACQWVEILTTSIDDELNKVNDLDIYPNPFSDVLTIRSKSGLIRPTHLQLFDTNGHLVIDQANAPVPVNIHLPLMAPGMYLCVITERDGTVYSFKIMKI